MAKQVVRKPDGTLAKGSAPINPGGRPKEAAEVKALAREHGPHAIMRLAELVDGDDPRTAVAACRELLDRAYGRPVQMIANDPSAPFSTLSLPELLAEMSKIMDEVKGT